MHDGTTGVGDIIMKTEDILSAIYKIHYVHGRDIFTAKEIEEMTNYDNTEVRSVLASLKKSGLLASFYKPHIKCGTLICRILSTIWKLTDEGIDALDLHSAEYNEYTKEYIFKGNEANLSDEFVMDMEEFVDG